MRAVVIAGGGPTGLMLAGELALAGIDVVVAERRPSQELSGSRALGITARAIEVLDQRSIADRFLAAGQTAQVAGFGTTRLDMTDFPTRHNYGLALRQKHIERLLAEWVTGLGVPILYGHEITGFAQDDSEVEVRLADGQSLRAQYLVGCDGGRSIVRKTAGIDFPGWDPTTSSILAEVEMTGTPPYGVHRSSAVFEFLHRARPVLINFGEPGAIDLASWSKRVECVDARHAGAWQLPVLGEVPAPDAVLIRPDGHVAWVGDGTMHGLPEALTMWFG